MTQRKRGSPSGVGSALRLTQPTVDDVHVSEDWLEVMLKDGRRIAAPLDWFPRLKAASLEDRATWEPCAAGFGIHWPTIDEDLSVEGLLKGTPAT